MKKTDMIDRIASAYDMSKAEAERILNTVFDTIKDELARGGSVDLPGFGKFVAQARAARTARNPRTGATVNVAATTVPKFKAAKGLKDATAGN